MAPRRHGIPHNPASRRRICTGTRKQLVLVRSGERDARCARDVVERGVCDEQQRQRRVYRGTIGERFGAVAYAKANAWAATTIWTLTVLAIGTFAAVITRKWTWNVR